MQTEQELLRIFTQWIESIRAGKRKGKQFLEPNQFFSEENTNRIVTYALKNYHTIDFVALDKSLDLLARGNQLQGFETPIGSHDISTPMPSRGSLSLESNGST